MIYNFLFETNINIIRKSCKAAKTKYARNFSEIFLNQDMLYVYSFDIMLRREASKKKREASNKVE